MLTPWNGLFLQCFDSRCQTSNFLKVLPTVLTDMNLMIRNQFLGANGFARRMPKAAGHSQHLFRAYDRGQKAFQDLLQRDLVATVRKYGVDFVLRANSPLRRAPGFEQYALAAPSVDVIEVSAALYHDHQRNLVLSKDIRTGLISPLYSRFDDVMHLALPAPKLASEQGEFVRLVMIPLEMILVGGLNLMDVSGDLDLVHADQIEENAEFEQDGVFRTATPVLFPPDDFSSFARIQNVPAHVVSLYGLHNWLQALQSSNPLMRAVGFDFLAAMSALQNMTPELKDSRAFQIAKAQVRDQNFSAYDDFLDGRTVRSHREAYLTLWNLVFTFNKAMAHSSWNPFDLLDLFKMTQDDDEYRVNFDAFIDVQRESV